ncbi:MAG: TrkH family potassium uptake protein [Candidatus Cloacimonadaceae bacterium]|jgi:trk system potassium uptake protein TrkH
MNAPKARNLLGKVEILAYLLAIWSFLVLFFDPVISYYADYALVEYYTAWANLIVLFLTILNRLLNPTDKRQKGFVLFDVFILVLGFLLLFYKAKLVVFFLLIRQTWYIIQFLLFRAFDGRLYKLLTENPPITVMLSFIFVILTGTVLLMMPASSAQGQVTAPVDALFIATSATCVTGLVVVDVGTHFSLFGQLVILLLIQVGGLGLMTISTAFAIALGQRLTLKLESTMYKVVGGSQSLNVLVLLKNIMLATLIIESLGAAFLYLRFRLDFTPLQAFYQSVFHAVSAFCNAGISLLPCNLSSYVGDYIVNIGITGLIILGGIGFNVIIDLQHYIFRRGKVRKLTLHSKIVLLVTAILLALGTISFFFLEYHGVMQGFSIKERILTSWFNSVSARTAGFNVIDIGSLSKASMLITIVLMFIGASPGSTGGGIKTTTIAVLALSIIGMFKGTRDLTIFNRKIPNSNSREATSLIVLSALIIFIVLFVLLLVEPFSFEDLLFEAVSAFGTAGLSTGITPILTSFGKLLIIFLMYVGRIGPLTLIYAFAVKKSAVNLGYAEEKIAIG